MKSGFSKSWNRSRQPRKQVKFRSNAPNHIRRRLLGTNLDKFLRKTYGRRNIEVRKGDEVKVMRGKFKGKQGKVGKVDTKRLQIQIDGIQREKLGGEKLETWFDPSNIKIISLDTSDNKRLKRVKKKINQTETKSDKSPSAKENKNETKSEKRIENAPKKK